MKIKVDIKSENFFAGYVEKYGQFEPRLETSRLIYLRIIRLFFKFMQQKLLEGYVITTPIGYFKVVRTWLNVRRKKGTINSSLSEIHQKAIVAKQDRDHFWRVKFGCSTNLEGRYRYFALQLLSKEIPNYFD